MAQEIKKGDKLRCITTRSRYLTEGKEYEALSDHWINEHDDKYVSVQSDGGEEIDIWCERFDIISKAPAKDDEMKEHDNLDELAMNELSVRAQYFMVLADDAFHKSNNQLSSHYLLVAERFFNEMKIRVITTAI